MNEKLVALVVADDRLFTAPDDLDRPAEAALGQAHGRQGQHNLHRHILTAAKRAANRGVDDANLIWRQLERMGNLELVFMRPLPGHLDGDAAGLVYGAEAGLGLEEGMLLH